MDSPLQPLSLPAPAAHIYLKGDVEFIQTLVHECGIYGVVVLPPSTKTTEYLVTIHYFKYVEGWI